MVEISSWYHHQADRTICDTCSFVFQLIYPILSMCRLKQHLQEWCSKKDICKGFLIRLNNKKAICLLSLFLSSISSNIFDIFLYIHLQKLVETSWSQVLVISLTYYIPHFFPDQGQKRNYIGLHPCLYNRTAKTGRNTKLAQKTISNMQHMCGNLAESREHWLWDNQKKKERNFFWQNPSIAHNFGTTGPIQVGVFSKMYLS